MNLLCCGINHKTAPIALREQFALSEANLMPALHNLQIYLGDAEAMLISTCNRLEVYSSVESVETIINWLSHYFQIDAAVLPPLMYVKHNQAVVEHAIRVASGLDSMILGEPQIFGQMKCSYAQAGEAGCIGQQLGHLFPFVFAVAKRIRTETQIGQNSLSVAHTAVNLVQQHVTNLAAAKVLLVGAGETIELVAKHLAEQGVTELVVANRTLDRAETIAQNFQAKPILIKDIPQYIAAVDIVITSTASQLPLIGKGLIERIMKQRAEQSLLIVDLAVPRDVESEVAELANVSLYNIDDLKNIVATHKNQRQEAAQHAENIINEEMAKFQRWQDALDSVPMICAYRDTMQKIRDVEVSKALADLALGKDPQTVVQDLARALTNKLMHNPSVEMRKASSEGRLDLLQWSQQLLGIQANESVDRDEIKKFG